MRLRLAYYSSATDFAPFTAPLAAPASAPMTAMDRGGTLAARDEDAGTSMIRRKIGFPAGWWRRRQTRRALAQLDDRMLRDIGLDRMQVRAITG